MVLLVSAMMLLFIVIPVVGLAIDAGILYAVKAKLQTAVDGAALGAARSLSRGLDLASQQTAATDTATRWYHANFPVSWMGVAAVTDPTVTFPVAPPKTTIVNVAGTIQSPTYFMRIFNVNAVTVNTLAMNEIDRDCLFPGIVFLPKRTKFSERFNRRDILPYDGMDIGSKESES